MRRLLIIVVVALFCCGFIPQHTALQQREQVITDRYAEAMTQIVVHYDTIKAKQLFHSVLELDSMHAPSLSALSRISNEPQECYTYAKRAYLADTTNSHYTNLYRHALLGVEKYREAIDISYRIIEKSTEPNDYYILSILLAQLNLFDKAEAVLNSAYERLGRVEELMPLHREILLKMGNTAKAEALVQEGINNEPYNVERYIPMAELYADTGRDSLAVSTYYHALEIDDNNLPLLVSFSRYFLSRHDFGNYLVVAERLFRHEDASLNNKISTWDDLIGDVEKYKKFQIQYNRIIRTLFEAHPNNALVLKRYRDHLIAIGEVEQAVNHYKRYVEESENATIDDYLFIIEGELYLNRPDSTQRYALRMVERFPKRVEPYNILSYLARNRGDYEEAVQHLGEGLKYANPSETSDIWCQLGDIAQLLDDKKRCEKAYKMSLKYNSDNHVTLNNYAYRLAEWGCKLKQALEMSSRVISINKSNPTYIDTHAWVLYKLGRHDEAKRYMQQALSLDRENSPDLALHYGDILFALGDTFMAEHYWNKALERGYDKEKIAKRLEQSKQR